jgi:hypothetical protein
MEEKIKITPTTTEEGFLAIINGNTAEETAKALSKYMTKQTSDWYGQYDRANKAEKELADIKAILVGYAIKKIKEEYDIH